jgi:N utilization substance protein A
MAFDMLEAIGQISREKNIDLETVVSTLEASLMQAAKRKYPTADNISFRFDKRNNELFMISTRKVVEEVTDPILEIRLKEAREIDKAAELGDDLDVYLDYEAEFGRNAIASAKQILVQRIREVEHERIYNEYVDKVGTLISGVVQHMDKGNVYVNLGRGEGVLFSREQIPRERFRQGDRVRALIQDVQKGPRGPQITLSRVNNDFLRALFAMEVPEIYERVIEIKAISREPGERAKIAVWSSDERIDPVGACVGIKGVRVQAIVRELNNERIDIVPYSANPEVFVTRALAPAKVTHIDIMDIEQKMTVVVEDEKLSLAIGRNGQNARLASKLTGWKINIMSDTEYEEQRKRDAEMLLPVGQLEGVGDKIRDRLIASDISSVQRLASSTVDTLVKIEGIGQKTAETLIERAKEMVEQLEKEQRKRERTRKKDPATKSDKLTESDIFEDDDELVTEADTQMEVQAPTFDDEFGDSDVKKDLQE